MGASDDLGRGQSTFLGEMVEAANIFNNATARSLVILDEVGRGTSTYDGLSLTWSISEYLHDRIGCRSLFATHYHELTLMADTREGARGYTVVVQEESQGLVFLHRLTPGSVGRSYGIHAARLAGVPQVRRRRGGCPRQGQQTQGRNAQEGNVRQSSAMRVGDGSPYLLREKKSRMRTSAFGRRRYQRLLHSERTATANLPPL